MQNYLYSIIGILALLVHIIINQNLFKRDKNQAKIQKSYQYLMISIFAYYITDACWGLFAGMKNNTLLFIDTTVYFIAMASAVLCWTIYVINYLSINNLFGKIVKYFIWIIFFSILIGLAINPFIPCFFLINPETGIYEEQILRNITLWIQISMFSFTALLMTWRTFKTSGIIRKRHIAILLFSLIMIVANIVQLLNSTYPVYAMGCLVGCCILHVYVVEDEREQYRKQISEEKQLAENANQAKTDFLFNMSHDIRTPMNAIIGFTSMAKKHVYEPENTLDYLEKIDIAGSQLLKLINQVLEMARIESGKITLNEHHVNLSEKSQVLNTIYLELARAKDVKFNVLPFKITHYNVVLDVDRMDQITNNIISNAIKYTPSGGTITCYTEELPCEKEGYIYLKMSVEDTGIGMSEEFLAHIFEEFARENSSTVSHIQGTGLGMSIVKKVSELMGGKVEIESKKDVGTKVTVYVPVRIDDEVVNKKDDETNLFVDFKGLKVLLVEDNEMNREIATEILSENGIIVDTAEDGDIAVEKVKNSNPGDYDLILMDVQMPKMNGYDATREIRKLPNKDLANIIIIAMTANAFEEDRQNALNAGMNDHIAKPIDVVKLFRTISKFIK